MSFGFGQLPGLPASVSSEDLARLFGPGPLGAGQGFSGSATGPIPPAEQLQAPAVVPMTGAPLPPPRPPGFGFGAIPVAAQQEAVPAMPQSAAITNPPAPPPRPLSFGSLPTPEADMPAADAVPTSGTMPAPESPGGGFLSRLGDPRISNMLIGLGTGLLTNKGFGPGVAAGVGTASKLNAQQAATDLAQADYGLKTRKLQQEDAANNLTAKSLLAAGHAPEKVQLAISAARAGHSEALNNLLTSSVPKPQEAPFGWTRQADGSVVPTVGGPQDPATLKAHSQATAEGSNAAKPEETTADQKNYEQAKKEGYAGTLLDYQVLKANASKAQTTINNAVNPVLKGLGEQFVEGAAGARAAAETARAVTNARSQLDAPGGIFAGQWAENKLALQKMGAAFGITDPAAIANTETFRTQIKPIVLETVKGLGAGSGVSNADRDFALQAVGGDIKLDEATIRRVLDITDRSARAKVERHNSMASQMLETQPELKQVAPMLQVQLPEPYSAAAASQAQSAQPSDPLAAARAAISRGAPRDRVMQRLLQSGIDPKGL